MTYVRGKNDQSRVLEAGDGSVGTANYMIISLTKSNKYQNLSLPFVHDVKIRCFGTKKKLEKHVDMEIQ